MSPIKAAVLSAGAWSQSSHLPALAADTDVDIISVTSPDGASAEKSAATFGAAHWSTDWREALARAPDIVVVSSPPVAHEEMVIGALQAGAHVLVEKPFALDAASAIRMRNAALAAGRHLLIGFGWPAAPIFAKARALVEAGEIGTVEHLTFHLAVNTRALLSGGTDGGWGGEEASNVATYTDPRISAGGSVAVSMSHQLGLLEWLTGDEIVAVQASTFPVGAPIDLHASVNAELRGGGSAAISSASTHPYLARPQWHLALYGNQGQLWLDSIADHLRLVRANGEIVTFEAPAASGVYDAGAPTKALIACARGADAPAGLNAHLATRVVAVTDAIYESARSGGKLRIDIP
ncbi:Gfo/Idh/MocA family oxidoreductase [Devosia sp. YIM 151766]|uniref:Gfo/Idh/MocA family protein n=1 Tax=Devosia sp. YIM 151766 TaxID=3017325 RepID=UPI00255CE1A6|nr:Gfo/Idh/MocA family oxidoreductase [Devosia sp. YIM 151766]WIY52539.1 Gfo/Idh/MocA family oxidoreductase [Devosia sp. YIM 151766]